MEEAPSGVARDPMQYPCQRSTHQTATRFVNKAALAAPPEGLFDLCFSTGSATLSQGVEDTHTQGGILEAQCERIGTPVVEQDVSRRPGVGYTGCTPSR